MESMSELDKLIKNSIENATPDCLDSIMKNIDVQPVIQKNTIFNRKVFVFTLVCTIILTCIGLASIINVKSNPQILKYYVPFHATQIDNAKYPAPGLPLSYQELEHNSNYVLLGTIKKVGTYRDAKESNNPKASFGVYIYTIEIDHLLKGQINTKQNILVKEKGLAYLENNNVKLTPYSERPDKYRKLCVGKKYVLFCSNKDSTGCYNLSFNGFGIFEKGYVEAEHYRDLLKKLEQKYDNEVNKSPLKDDILYRICALNIKHPLHY